MPARTKRSTPSATKRGAFAWGFERYGLTLDEVLRLGEVGVDVIARLPSMSEHQLLAVPPNERIAHIHTFRVRRMNAVVARWPSAAEPNVEHHEGTPTRLFGRIRALELQALLALPVVDVEVARIEGREPVREKAGERFFGVLARYAVEVEGRRRGMQTIEERTLLVRARSEDGAARKVVRSARAYGQPYLNDDARLVRWRLEEIIDVYDTTTSALGDELEVYSKLESRRLTPARVWDPRGEGKSE
jgi:hypothetical protein